VVDSITTVYKIIFFKICDGGIIATSLYISPKANLHLSEKLPPNIENIPMVNVIKPSPPNCIRRRIIACPANVKSFPVSSTMRPVTQTADVDVKRESINDIPFTVAQGSCSSNEPARIRKRKLAMNC
jgi:hypothetical protein